MRTQQIQKTRSDANLRAATPNVHRSARARLSSHWTNWGQWLALITMTTDHVTRYLLPDAWDMGWASSSIGRIAFPLFAAMVAWHGLFNTRNVHRYAWRILVIGLFAQIPYMTMPRAAFQLNICFTLALGLVWGYWLRELARRVTRPSTSSAFAMALIAASLILWYGAGYWVEYHHLGLLLIPAYMLAFQTLSQMTWESAARLLPILAALPVLLVAGSMNSSDMAKFFTVATTLVMLCMA
ncbi:MAG TPA: TraX family protein, partial [Salinisphaeraceae bacterium]|nr:TraX family protein [Salinisphaeraceae bacterium]